MTVRVFVFGSFIAALFGAAVFALTITQLSPESAGALGFIMFFLSLFVTVASVVALLGYGVRRIITPGQFPVYAVRTSLRQGGMISLFLSALLFLQLFGLYRWWIALIIVAVFLSFELIFVSYDRSARKAS